MLPCALLVAACGAAEYFVKWDGDDKRVCHPMLPCRWDVAAEIFQREDILQITDPVISSREQLTAFQNLTKYVVNTGGGIASSASTIVDGSLWEPNLTDFFLEIEPFNESILFGFTFVNFSHPILSVRGMELFTMVNCSFENNTVSLDFPMISCCNVTVIMANSTIHSNIVDGSSILGLNTAILGLFNSSVCDNVQMSRGVIPLMEFTNGAAEITNTTILRNISPNSPLLGSWFFIVVILTNSSVQENFCSNSALVVGDSLANITLVNTSVVKNRAALLHSMTMSSLNMSASVVSENDAAGQAFIFAPRSKIEFFNGTVIDRNIADSMISSQLTNESSLKLVSAAFRNNICSDTAFALLHSDSVIDNASIHANVVVTHPLLYLRMSNFTINFTSFEDNWATGEGNVVEVYDGNVDVSGCVFRRNRGRNVGAFQIYTEENSTFNMTFTDSDFEDNEGVIVKSVLFQNKLPPSRFAYCNFSRLRFDEVNGDLNSEQLFHRCRFSGRARHNPEVRVEQPQPRSHDPLFVGFILYVSVVLIALALFVKRHA